MGTGTGATAMAAVAKAKLAALILAGTLVVGGGAATGVTVAANNGAFGTQVAAQVQLCKSELKTGTHGIGQCVSQFAKQHGPQERQQHSQGKGKPTSTPGAGASNGHGASSNASSHATTGSGNAGSHGGPPSTTPGGSSTSHP